MREEILNLIKDKRLLLAKEIFDILENFEDPELAKSFLENLEKVSGQKVITKSSLNKNYEYAKELAKNLSGNLKESVEKTLIKLGITLEIKKERQIREVKIKSNEESPSIKYKIIAPEFSNEKKIEVKDFVGHFRSRYQQIQRILLNRQGLNNLTSINKIPIGTRQKFTIIGIVAEKRVTKNKNLIIKFEDLTGEVSALVKNESESFLNASELQLDDVVAVKCSGNREITFVHEIIYPDAILLEKTKFDKEAYIAFISDIHAGSKKHLKKEFQNFVYWLNSDNELAKKIEYIFFVGDNVDGVGIFPGQENSLEIKNLREQYNLLAAYLDKIPKRIAMFMCPGQHDSVRVMEPQPPIDEHYGADLYEISNLVLVPNPCMVKLLEGDKEFRILMYHGGSIHALINEIEELRLMKAHNCPAKAIKHMLKRRHLAPMHGVSPQIVYVPCAEKDPMVIEEVPNILCTGEVHRVDIERYNGILIITGSCWQSQTAFEEKLGNIPDPCKVPLFNLKTSEMKILDFLDEFKEGENENK